MTFLNFPVRFITVLALVAILFPGCKSKVKSYKSPPHYNFASKFLTYKLDQKLLEISGLAWDQKNSVYYAVQDESDRLFILDKEDKMIKDGVVIGEKGDYEEVAIHNGSPYILRSDGLIIKFVRDSSGKGAGREAGELNIKGEKDFEAMYSDPSRNALVVICKNCAIDGENSVSAFAFYPDSIGYDDHPLFVIDAKKINDLSPVKSSKFQPSAAAIHPILKKLFILSSASNQLVITDLNGKVESVHRLSPKLFPQPEGITFQTDGDMLISNEGLTTRRKPNILKFEFVAVSDTAKALIGKAGYNFVEPDEKLELGKHLHEISGMAYVPKKNVILTENDEKGDIFVVDFNNKQDNEGKIKFGGKGDYEDIVYTDTAVYMLVATGTVVKVLTKDSSFTTQEFVLDKKGINEFEAMYMDADGKSLILLCKDCDHEKNEIRMAHRFDLVTNTFDPAPAYTIQIADIQAKLNDGKAEFKPSAAGINPLNGKLYIVASVGKVLVIADRNGKIEEVIKLDPILYNQPEGLTFASNGDLYISNEGGEGIATIFKFIYKK